MTELRTMDVALERRRAGVVPVPNPGRRASDRVLRVVERQPSRGRSLSGVPSWLVAHSRWLRASDAAVAAAAALMALVVRFGARPSVEYLVITALFPVGWVLLLAANRAYEPRFLGAGNDEYRRCTQAALRFAGTVAFLAYTLHSPVARGYLFLAIPLSWTGGMAARRLLRRRLHRRRQDSGSFTHRVVVAGTERSAADLIRQVRRHPDAGFDVVGVSVTGARGGTVEGVPVVSTGSDLIEALSLTGADTVAVAAQSDLTHAHLRRLGWELEGSGVSVLVAPTIADVAGPRIHIRPVAGLPLLHVEQPEFRGSRRWLKTLLDRSVAILALLLLLPLFVVVALAVRLGSRGPVLFRQTRVGEGGRTFTMVKFRSMYTDAEEQLTRLRRFNETADGLLFKMREDPRVTPVGRILRRYSLDQLPQLLNIVVGHMSLVGPRPPLPHEVSRYGGDVGRRLLVRPGLTGLWQVSGRSELLWDEAVRLDLEYVENWSLTLDFVILWRTLAAVVSSRGAY